MTIETLPRPIAAAHAWRGPEMAARQDWIRPLTNAEIAALDAEVRRLDASGIDIAAIGPADMPVPALAGLIGEIRRQVLHAHGFILLRGLPRRLGPGFYSIGELPGAAGPASGGRLLP